MNFDEARLDDPAVLSTADLRLRGLAESGARVRREARGVDEVRGSDLDRLSGRPRAIVLLGADSALVSAALTPVSTVPVLHWTGTGLPTWTGPLDLVVVLAPDGGDPALARAVAEASRRGCRVLVAAPAASIVADHATGADALVVPVLSADRLAISVATLVLLDALEVVSTGDVIGADGVNALADALDQVAVECSPMREFSLNPAKLWAIALSDTVPVVWGGSVWAAAAAEMTAQALRRATGQPALASASDGLLPVVEAARVASIFDDPIEDGHTVRPSLVLLEDGADLSDSEALLRGRRALVGAADARNVRVEVIEAPSGTPLSRYAQLALSGQYAAEYLRLGQIE